MWDMIDGGDSGMQCLAAIGENYSSAWPSQPKNQSNVNSERNSELAGRAVIGVNCPCTQANCASRTWIKHKVYR